MESDNGSEQGRDEGRGPLERDMVAPAQSRALWERIDASKGPGREREGGKSVKL